MVILVILHYSFHKFATFFAASRVFVLEISAHEFFEAFKDPSSSFFDKDIVAMVPGHG
jgi:hypothetical protein